MDVTEPQEASGLRLGGGTSSDGTHDRYDLGAITTHARKNSKRGERVPRGGPRRELERHAIVRFEPPRDLDPERAAIAVDAEHMHRPSIGALPDRLKVQHRGQPLAALEGLATNRDGTRRSDHGSSSFS